MFTAKSVMTTKLVAVRPDAPMREVADLLVKYEISGVPVTESNGRLAGIISEYDLMKLVYEPDQESSLVADHMTRAVVTIPEDARLTEIADLFLNKRYRRFPVVRDGLVTGVVSRHDLVRFVRKSRDHLAAGLEASPQPAGR